MRVGSLFSGIGGFDLGFDRAGHETIWQVEIDANCRDVLRRWWPDTTIREDVRDCGSRNLEPVDIITFGSPCTDLSVAGKREGIHGQQSGLFFEAARIIGELQPALAVWENVPGALSSNAGRDFAAVLHAFRELGARDIGWATLNAQYFGVAQRRRRVFVVADFTPTECAAEILFESEGMCWHPATSREAGQGVAAPLKQSTGERGWGLGAEDALSLVPEVAASQGGGSGQRGWAQDTERMTFVPVSRYLDAFNQIEGASNGTLDSTDNHCVIEPYNIIGLGQEGRNHAYRADVSGALQHKGLSASGNEAGTVVLQSQAFALTAKGQYLDGTAETLVLAHSLRAQGQLAHRDDVDTLIAAPLTAGSSSNGVNPPGRRKEDDVNLVAHPLTARHDSSEDGCGRGVPLIADPITASYAKSADSADRNAGPVNVLVEPSYGVRRLTPVEAERLQGFPDNWTEYGASGKRMADSTRYRMLGNAVCVPVAAWLGRRILQAITEPLMEETT